MEKILQKAPEKKTALLMVIGVGHDPATQKEEVARVMELLEKARAEGAVSVGLELSSDYVKLEKEEGLAGYFNFVAEEVEKIGLKVVPLESPATQDEMIKVEVAKRFVKDGAMGVEGFERALAELRSELEFYEDKIANPSGFDHPEMIKIQAKGYRHWVSHYEKAGEILKETGFSAEGVLKVWREMQDRRDSEMLAEIGRQKPDVVVVGTAHARTIAKNTETEAYFELGEFEQ